MKRVTPANRVRLARLRVAAAENELAQSALPWRQSLRKHQSAVAICGGFTSGLALAMLPPSYWGRFGATLGATAAWVARSALAPPLIGALLSQLRRSAEPVKDAAETTTD
jgi:hypothetical protein